MEQFHSEVKQIAAAQEVVYEKLSDLSGFQKIKERIPAEHAGKLSFTDDTMTLETPMGGVTLKIVEREPVKCVKFGTVTSPLPFNVWIQLLPLEADRCKMRITLGLDLNPFMLSMARKPLQESVDKLADMLAMMPY